MTWQEWLRVDEAKRILDKCAVYISIKISSHSRFTGIYDTEELTGEIWVFCNNNADSWENKKPFDVLYAQGIDSVIKWIVNGFMLHISNESRKYQHSPTRYLYSRVRVSLSSSDDIFKTHSNKMGTYYTCCTNLPWREDNSITIKDFRSSHWSFPANVSEKNIYEKDTIIQVGRYFWNQVREKTGRDLWIPIRDLVRYIGAFLPIPETHSKVSIDEQIDEETETNLGDILIDPDMPPTDEETILEDLRKKAEKCALQLAPEEREAIALHHGEGRPLQEIATSMGYSSPSGVSYILQKAYHRIRNFCKPIPGLSPPDIDEELFTNFMENVIIFCKIHSPDLNE